MFQRKIIKTCAIISGLSGMVILFSTFFPIVAYEWESGVKYPTLISPLADAELEKYGYDLDSTKASSWFVGAGNEEKFVSDKISYFTISIPRLKIDNATVAIGGEELSQSLIQYPGTALPGKRGNSVIFGHSVLPLFYDPANYISIFSTLNTLKDNDEIFVNYDGVTYKYSVENMFEVKPTDIQILDQDATDSFLTLVTCTPPGDPRKPKRLIVRARIMPVNQANAAVAN
jgi:sortase A